MLSAEKMSKALRYLGIKVLHYEESKKPKYMDGEVILENSLSVQVGFDYACLCLVEDDGIDYLLEIEGIYNEIDFATEVAKFFKNQCQ